MERTPIDEWIEADEVDLEQNDQIPESPESNPEDLYGHTGKVERDDGMKTGMIGFLATCSGREDVKERVVRDAEEALKVVSDVGGSAPAYKRQRKTAMQGIVFEIYSSPRTTKMVKMMPSSGVLAGSALDLTTHDTDGRAWNSDGEEMRQRARKKVDIEEHIFLIGLPFCTPYSPPQALPANRRDPEEVKREQARAAVHMEFATGLACTGRKYWPVDTFFMSTPCALRPGSWTVSSTS